MCTTGTSASMVPTSSQAATSNENTWKKNSAPWPTSRINAYAAANDATRYMLSRSRWPPSSEPVACIAALAGPSSTVTTAYAVGSPRSRGSTSPSSQGLPARQATARPATTKPRLDRLFAGWTQSPKGPSTSWGTSQKTSPRPTSAPSQSPATASTSRPTEATATVAVTTIGVND